MKTFRVLLMLLVVGILLTHPVQAQEEPTKPEYEKKVYVDENGFQYVQKSLPLYLKFSTTPDGKNYNLKSKTTAKYADPMYLDTEGVNWIRSRYAVDPETGKTVQPPREVMYEVYSDGLAPYTSIRLTGAPKYVRGGVVYYGKGLSFSLSSRDGVSGVEKTHYSLNAGSYSDYSSDVNVDTEKEYALYWYSHDKVGNAEKTRSRKFTVDHTPPSSTHEIVGISHQGNILAPSTKFKVTTTDALSGVRSVYYTYDDRGRSVYPGYNVSMHYLPDGDHTFHYWSIDNVKNEATRSSFSFYLDKIAPEVSYKIEGDLYEGKYKYISARTKISLSATDNKAGVKEINYNIDGGARQTYTAAFNMPDRLGLHTTRYNGTDNVENASGRRSFTIYMDNRAPETGIVYGKPQFFTRDTLFINSKTNISLYPKDYQSGVAKTEYAIDGGGFKDYARFNIENEGFHTITFKATDRVNNVEQVKESFCYVDNTPPVIFHNFSIQPIGTRNKGGGTHKVYPNYTRLYLGATDAKTGTASITYSMDDGKTWSAYSSPYTLDISELNRFKKNKFYSVKVKATDKLGNTSEATIEFFVGREK